ncbi:hypothetical protein IEQ34_009713 [Dendrobium chrysotoxum]|uniref:Ubiquitin-like protease family profile domain-containing protein n=1 Tax=Dendrobium chrysotoxum TaxID=161865 RepID=A0AAV7H376_DENCH|nr:hypothetical protein IEQ34_009713 [Dendrobium chrysotoxum]
MTAEKKTPPYNPNLNVILIDTSVKQDKPNQPDLPMFEGKHDDDGLASTIPTSTGSTGIAKRLRRRADRKAKEVKTPFTTGQNKMRKTMLIRKAVARPTPPHTPTTAIIQVYAIKSSEPIPTPPKLEYPDRAFISEEMRNFVDNCLQKYTEMGDLIYSAGNVQIFRSQIDKLLTDQYLHKNHIEAFVILLAEKNTLHPGHYYPFIFVSILHWESVITSNFLLMPVANKSHWTLLVVDLKSKAWIFFDSLPNPIHRAVLPDVINHLYLETYENYFGGDVRNWPLRIATEIPTQTNGFDCRIELLRVFFINLYIDSSYSALRSSVNHCPVKLTTQDFHDILQLLITGDKLYLVSFDPDFDWSIANNFLRNTIAHYHDNACTSLFKDARTIQHVLCSSIIPKAGDRIHITPFLSKTTYYIMAHHNFNATNLIFRYIEHLTNIRDLGHRRHPNLALGHLIAYALETKYNL